MYFLYSKNEKKLYNRDNLRAEGRFYGDFKTRNLTYPEKKEQNAGAVPADSFPLCSPPCEHSAEKPCGPGKPGAGGKSGEQFYTEGRHKQYGIL